MQKKCKICIKNINFEVVLNNSTTASLIWKNLPITSLANLWGDEVYFFTPIEVNQEKDATALVNFGDLAFWPAGKAIAIGFGKTPISIGSEIRLAEKCNIWGRTKFDLKVLKRVKNGDEILVKRI